MWRYWEGVKEPPVKKPRQSDEEKRQLSREYEQECRKRRWNNKWLVGEGNKRREWLEYDGEKMFCVDCKQYATGEAQKKGPFVLGTQNFKLESIKEHEKSQGH